MKNLWFRAGVTLQLNDDEVDTILKTGADDNGDMDICLLYTSPSPRDTR